MSIWKRLVASIFPHKETNTQKGPKGDLQNPETFSPPNSLFGRGASGRTLKPNDPSNPANPFSPFKKDRW